MLELEGSYNAGRFVEYSGYLIADRDGIYEFQLERLDRELAELTEAYHPYFGKQFFSTSPQMMLHVTKLRTLA